MKELLAKPLGPTEAVQIALLNNPGLQASYAEVGIAEADLVQAGRWQGPKFSFARLRRGDEIEIERGVFFDVLGLMTMPLSTRASESRLQATQNRAAAEALRIGAATRARHGSGRRRAGAAPSTWQQVKESAEASAELARRMAEAGNFPQARRRRASRRSTPRRRRSSRARGTTLRRRGNGSRG